MLGASNKSSERCAVTPAPKRPAPSGAQRALAEASGALGLRFELGPPDG